MCQQQENIYWGKAIDKRIYVDEYPVNFRINIYLVLKNQSTNFKRWYSSCYSSLNWDSLTLIIKECGRITAIWINYNKAIS